MSASDRVHEAVQDRLDRMSAEDRAEWLDKFAEETDFEGWLYDQVEQEVRTDATESHPDHVLYIGRGA